MAPWMKMWGGLTALGLGATAVMLLPPEPTSFQYRAGPRTAEVAYNELNREMGSYHEAYKRTRWADSLSELAIASQIDGMAIALPPHDEVDPAVVEFWEDRVRSAFTDLDTRTNMVFGYFLQPSDHAGIEGVERGNGPFDQLETYIGARDGQTFCLQVRVVDERVWQRRFQQQYGRYVGPNAQSNPPSNFLSGCRNYMRFGEAGPHVQSWLESGAFGFLTSYGTSINAETRERYRSQPAPFGYGVRLRGSANVVEDDLCVAGDFAACAAVVSDPELLARSAGWDWPVDEGGPAEIAERSPMTFPALHRAGDPFGYGMDAYLISDLELEFGTEAMRSFWTSELEVPEAFEASFGVEMGEWVYSWVTQMRPTRTAGPSVPGRDLWLSLLMVSAMGWIATATSFRRRLGQ